MSDAKQPSQQHLLVVEDSPVQSVMLVRMLEHAGYTVHTAANGRLALAYLDEHNVDLVITDINMPEMSGIALIEAIRQRPQLQNLRVMVVTGLASPADLLASATAGADQYIIKPYSEDFLLSRVSEELRHANEGLEAPTVDLTVEVGEHSYHVNASGQRLLKLLISTYESAAAQNANLAQAQLGIQSLNSSLQRELDRVRASEGQLRMSEANFRSIVSLVPDVVYRIDTEGRFEFVNEAIRMYGWTPEELIGQHFSVLLATEDVVRVSRKTALEQGPHDPHGAAPKLFDERRTKERATVGLELAVRCKQPGGEHCDQVMEVASSGLYTNIDGTPEFAGTIGVIRNIEQRKQYERGLVQDKHKLETEVETRTEELIAVNAQLERSLDELRGHKSNLESLVAQRTADLQQAKEAAETAAQTKSLFVATMSHEVRTPLNAILGLAYILKQSELNEQQRSTLTQIEEAGQRLAGIFNDVLDLSSSKSATFALKSDAFDVAALCHQVARQTQALKTARGLDIKLELPDSIPTVSGDAKRLAQALFNLAENGAKFTAKGQVAIRVTPEPSDGDKVHLLFEVQDTGEGIAPQDVQRLFTSFSQLDGSSTRRHGGAGLGLIITKLIVQAMGGEIGVDSEPNKGSRFWFRIAFARATPAQASDLALTEQEAHNLLSAWGPKLRVLLVDDDPINQKISRGFLNAVHFQVDTANNGREAVEAVASAAQPYDIVLMDHQMPVLGGLEATREIRALPDHNELLVIGLTASDPTVRHEIYLDAGMNDCVTKSATPIELYRKLVHWLHQRGKLTFSAPSDHPVVDDLNSPDVVSPATHAIEDRLMAALCTVPGLDAGLGLKAVLGQPRQLQQLLLQFHSRYNDAGQTLRDQWRDQDTTSMRALVHTMQGASSTLGLTAVSAACEQLRQAIHGSAPEEHIPAAIDAVELHVKVLGDALMALPTHDDAAAEVPDVAWEDFMAAAHKLAQSLANDEAGAVRLFAALRSCLAAHMSDDIDDLGFAIENFDYPQAREVLNRAIEHLHDSPTTGTTTQTDQATP